MKLDRYMVNLFFEIKRSLPLEQQRNMLVSSPDIGEIMTDLYQTTPNENIKLLTGIFLERAGENWIKKANSSKLGSSFLKKLVTNSASPSSTTKQLIQSEQTKPIKKQRIYRGQIVED